VYDGKTSFVLAFMPTVNSGSELRSAIQAVGASDPIITLAGNDPSVSFSSAVTLGKRSSTNPAPIPYRGYTVQGAGSSAATSATLQDTRIFQENIDSSFLPGTVQNLTLNYSSSSDGNALLSIESKAARTLNIKNVNFTGTTTGWNSNGNLYMSLRSFSNTSPLNTTFTLDNVNVSIKGQNSGFTTSPTTGGSAFFHNWNNSGLVTIKDSTFDEGGFRSSFNFYNFGALASSPTNVISGNTFKRTTNANVRGEGNLLGNVTATLTSNTFQDGAYVDLMANVSGITFNSNTFTTITGGYGIRATPTLTGTPTFSGTNTFNGPGLALKYNTTTPGSIAYSGTFSVNSQPFSNLIAGGEGNDTLNFSSLTTNAWISGDIGDDSMQGGSANDLMLGGIGNDTIQGNDGNDTIIGGDGDDTLFGVNGVDVLTGGNGADRFRWTNNGGFDTITDFSAVDGDQMTLSRLIFRPAVNTSQTLTAANFFTTGTFTASGSTLGGRVTSLTGTSATTTQVTNMTGIASGSPASPAGYYLFYNSTTSTTSLVYDADWTNTGGRQFAFNLTNITTQAAHDAIGASQFYAL
jgi:Ca2+-binding RTX toxin-like protein